MKECMDVDVITLRFVWGGGGRGQSSKIKHWNLNVLIF